MESIAGIEPMSVHTKHTMLRLITIQIFLLIGPTSLGSEQVSHPMLARPSVSEGFEKYRIRFEGDNSFKVFVLANDGAWSWRMRPTLESAIQEAMTGCAENTGLSGCKLFAVGNTIVWDLSENERKIVFSKYKSEKTTLDFGTAPVTSGSIYGFNNNYKREDDCGRYKVFAMSENSAWAFITLPTFEEARDDAIWLCDRYAGRRGLCRLLAVGDVVVWDMSEEALAEAIEDYKQRKPCK